MWGRRKMEFVDEGSKKWGNEIIGKCED